METQKIADTFYGKIDKNGKRAKRTKINISFIEEILDCCGLLIDTLRTYPIYFRRVPELQTENVKESRLLLERAEDDLVRLFELYDVDPDQVTEEQKDIRQKKYSLCRQKLNDVAELLEQYTI